MAPRPRARRHRRRRLQVPTRAFAAVRASASPRASTRSTARDENNFHRAKRASDARETATGFPDGSPEVRESKRLFFFVGTKRRRARGDVM